MTSIKVKFRPSSVATREGALYFLVSSARKTVAVSSGCRLLPEEWDSRKSMVVAPDGSPRLRHLLSVRHRLSRDAACLSGIARSLADGFLPPEPAEIVARFRRYRDEASFSRFMLTLIARHRERGGERTAETYTAALSVFTRFLGSKGDADGFMLHELSPRIVGEFETWLRGRGISQNTSSFYMRILRAAYNRAVEEYGFQDSRPFRNVYTGVGKTDKRAISAEALRKLRTLDLSCAPRLEYARDMFMLSLMLRGMSLVDMAYLRKTDLGGRHIIYNRRKTGQRLRVEWLPEMQAIVDKYPGNSTEYLLPILTHSGGNSRNAYRNKGVLINRNLKKIARMAGLEVNLTLYVARHTWATLAKSRGIPIATISECMGHDSETTTRIYLDELDTSVIDAANRLVLSSF